MVEGKSWRDKGRGRLVVVGVIFSGVTRAQGPPFARVQERGDSFSFPYCFLFYFLGGARAKIRIRGVGLPGLGLGLGLGTGMDLGSSGRQQA